MSSKNPPPSKRRPSLIPLAEQTEDILLAMRQIEDVLIETFHVSRQEAAQGVLSRPLQEWLRREGGINEIIVREPEVKTPPTTSHAITLVAEKNFNLISIKNNWTVFTVRILAYQGGDKSGKLISIRPLDILHPSAPPPPPSSGSSKLG